MGTFAAALRAIGDVKALPATVEIADGRLSIVAGNSEIGSWALNEIHLEEIPTGYRMAAEGEQILIELKDVDSFTAELQNNTKRRLSLGRKKPAKPQAPAPVEPQAPVRLVKVDEQPTRNVALPPAQEAPRTKESGWTEKGLAFVDGTLARANKRFGSYLPEWMFTRAMFTIAFGALLLMVVLPGLVSTFLLIAGGLLIVFGAVVYSDQLLASKLLPGRTTPQHVLLFGVAILMMGVLLGVIAR